MDLHTHAKINLALDVLERLDNGYHRVSMIMQSLELHDTVSVAPCDGGITLTASTQSIPCDETNLAHRAATLFFEHTGIRGGATIHIEKRIPVSAGLAGGSGNAAGVLRALDLLYQTELGEETLAELGARLGADVPFCLLTGTALAEGLGTELTPLEPFPSTAVLLVKPDVEVSTAWAYRNFDLSNAGKLDVDGIAAHITDVEYVSAHMGNALRTVTVPAHPEIARIEQKMLDCGALGAMMSGSGPTVFGLFANEDMARQAYHAFSQDDCFVALTRTVS
ncbi:MAG: 4-(cytidine 5'-diphospho)-2-C-methyl-D-erythritol kinase [Ruminococcaceae bacterium]|nr:4-(cytidine 5'-diphospho)-2-C-methyl-D-erythritol kinase [Oscillospiraceae bacterium]